MTSVSRTRRQLIKCVSVENSHSSTVISRPGSSFSIFSGCSKRKRSSAFVFCTIAQSTYLLTTQCTVTFIYIVPAWRVHCEHCTKKVIRSCFRTFHKMWLFAKKMTLRKKKQNRKKIKSENKKKSNHFEIFFTSSDLSLRFHLLKQAPKSPSSIHITTARSQHELPAR